jgi:hypothetical protein
MFSKRIGQKLLGLFFIFILLLNYPFLRTYSQGESIGGIPPLYFFLFLIWLGLIMGIAMLVEGKRR